jgi:hypothetical protein
VEITKPAFRIGKGLGGMSMILAVGKIVAGAAPGIQKPGALSHASVEQLARQTEGLGPFRD